MRTLVLVLTLALDYSFAAAAPSVPRAELPFRLTPRGGVIVRVLLDGRRPASFLVDTGSNGSAISESLVEKMRLPIVARATVTSAIGQKPRLVARIEHLSMSGVPAASILATVIPDRELALPDAASGIDGIIGQDVLSGCRYTIDYRTQRIIWRDGAVAAPRSAAVLALEPRDDRFLAVLPQRGSTLRLVPDTGSERVVLFHRDDDVAPPPVTDENRTEVSGVAGTGEGRLARLGTLRIGAATLSDVPVVIVERAPAAQTADGLLPLHIFARVTFNGPERQLVIEPR